MKSGEWGLFFVFLMAFGVMGFTPGYAQDAPAAASPDQVFMDALLEKGLFRLAEMHCVGRMKDADCPPALQAELTMQWMRVVMEQALAVTGKKQQEFCLKAENILEDFRKQRPESPWLPVVEYQWAIGQLALAERLCLEGKVMGDDPQRMKEAGRLLRQTISLLKTLDKTLENIPQDTPRKGVAPRPSAGPKAWYTPDDRSSPDGLSTWQRMSLRNNIQYHILLALKCQGESYPPGSDERLSSLTEALAQVQALWGISSDAALAANVSLAEIACHRLLEDYAEVKKRLAEMKKLPMSEDTQWNFLAERLRLYLATGDVRGAETLLGQEFTPEIIGKNGNLDCAFLEFFIARWTLGVEEEEDAKTVKEWHKRAFDMRDEIRWKDSPQWAYRAEILLSRMLDQVADAVGMPDDLDTRMLLAENACRSGDMARAVPACRRAWEMAVEMKDADAAVRVGVLAGAVLYQEGRLAESLAFYRDTAVTFPQHADAVGNHHIAVFLAGKSAQEALESGNAEEKIAETLDLYEELLLEHYKLWRETDPDIRRTLVQMEEVFRLRGKKREAVDVGMLLLAALRPDDAEFSARLRAAVETRSTLLQELRKTGESDAKLVEAVDRALAWAQPLLKKLPEGEDRAWLMLHTARWRLEYLPKTAGEAETLLRGVLLVKGVSSETRSAAQCLLILATVMQGRSENVAEMLKEISPRGQNTEALLAILKSLEGFAQQSAADAKTSRQYAELRLTVANLLAKETLPSAAVNDVKLAQAEAQAALGQTGSALAMYGEIAEKYPKSRKVQTDYARLLTDEAERVKTPAAVQKAQTQWRAVEKNSAQKSEAWFEAKYEIARLYVLAGEKENARKMVETLKILYPEMGGNEMRRKFESL